MALDTYSNLKTQIGDHLNRSDLVNVIPDFVTLAEAQMNRRLRVREMVGRATALLTGEFLAQPTDFRGPRSMQVSSSNPITPLKYVSPYDAMLLESNIYSRVGKPRVYTVIGDEFQFLPAADGPYTLEMTYWKALPALSGTNPSNWILAAHPDAYLYGSLLQSSPYLGSDERVSVWGQFFLSILEDMNKDDATASFGGALNMAAYKRSFG
jgi:hypothetical protein